MKLKHGVIQMNYLDLATKIATLLDRDIVTEDSSDSTFQMDSAFVYEDDLLDAGRTLVATGNFTWQGDEEYVDTEDPEEIYWKVSLISTDDRRDFTIALDGEITVYD